MARAAYDHILKDVILNTVLIADCHYVQCLAKYLRIIFYSLNSREKMRLSALNLMMI